MDSPSRSVTNSIKGRVWLAAGALAMLNCVVGLAAYLILSFLSADPLVVLFATFFVLALLTVMFGWWLASDVVRPVETVTLVARSLERSPSASLPRTTGAIETDQLLQTLHRSGQQLKNLISLMDDVAAGKIEAAAMPLESSDKLSASFQKLVSKVTDSISAKRDLDEFRGALSELSKEISGVRNGKLDLSIRSAHPQTKEVGDAIRFLATRLAELTKQVFATGSECERSVADARASIKSALEAIDERSGVTTNLQAISKDPSKMDSLLKDLADTVKTSSEIYSGLAADNEGSTQISNAAAQLRAGCDESVRAVLKLRNRGSQISQAARLAADIAKRTDLIVLNASIVSDGSPTTHLLLREMESLSAKSEELNRQIASSVECLNSEIAGVEKELTSLSELAPQIGNALTSGHRAAGAIVREIERVGELESKIRGESEETRADQDKLVQTVKKLSDLSLAAAMIRDTESSVQRLSNLFDNLRDSVSDLKITASIPRSPEPVEPAHPASNGPTGFETFIEIGAQGGEN